MRAPPWMPDRIPRVARWAAMRIRPSSPLSMARRLWASPPPAWREATRPPLPRGASEFLTGHGWLKRELEPWFAGVIDRVGAGWTGHGHPSPEGRVMAIEYLNSDISGGPAVSSDALFNDQDLPPPALWLGRVERPGEEPLLLAWIPSPLIDAAAEGAWAAPFENLWWFDEGPPR